MAAEPLVSCVIIFYNAERFLEEAIQSVIAQSYRNWELLLVDDGSTDAGAAIARRYVAQLPGQVKLLQHPGGENRGMSTSRNVGIRAAAGSYIGFLDADDVWLPNKLARQVAILEAEPRAGMVYGRTWIWHSWTGRPEDVGRDHYLELGVPPDTLVMPPRLFALLLENKVQSPTTCNALFRRTLFDQVGLFEERFRGMYEDQALFAKVELHAPVFVAGEHWAKYRQHPQSCSTVAERTTRYEAARLPFLDWLLGYLAAIGRGPSSAVWWWVWRERWFCVHPPLRRVARLPRTLAWRLRAVLSPGGAA